VPPLIVSPDQGSSESIPLADHSGVNEPQVTLAIIGSGGAQDAILLHVNHKGVDGSLVAAGIESQFPHQIGAGMGSTLDQGGADGGSEDGGDHQILQVARVPFPLDASIRGQMGAVRPVGCQWFRCPLQRFYGSVVPVDYGDNQMRWGVSP